MNPILMYFNGEKTESYIILLLGVIALVLALYFIVSLKTPFWNGVAITFIVVSLLEIVVGFTIITRTPKDILRVETQIQQQPMHIKVHEIPRMEKVMSNFVLFRYIEILLIIVGIALMYSSPNDTFLRGIGLGLFSQTSIVLILDFFAERRGYIYIEYLKEFIQQI